VALIGWSTTELVAERIAMLRMITRGLIVSTLSMSFVSGALAEPAGLSGGPSGETASSPVDEARVFCFNRASGRFLHWGACTGGAPRVYCRNRWTGRFLHWGAC
jgi:hypothetical protein